MGFYPNISKPAPTTLVLGLNGLTGWHLFRQSEALGPAWGTFRKRHLELERDRCRRVNLMDQGEVRAFFQHVRPRVLFHAWAMCDLDLCESEPELAWRINVEGTRLVLREARKVAELEKIVYVSTDHVFCGRRGGYDEEARPDPIHVYGRTKYEAEKLVRSSGLPFAIIRPGLLVGESFQGNKGPRDFLFSRIRAGKPTHYFTDEWRTPVRAESFARKALALGLSEKEGIFHVASRECFNRYDLANFLAREKGLPTQYIFPRQRREDVWAAIRPENLSLASGKGFADDAF